ncbi:MAG: 8-amino-7-oxononanoate synthase [Pseudomonadota bacterium]|nr:8-amino-7-oxononanoate synthase [Gammaproteobacteria bacterium]MDQ3583742.1 8-amino-7-oxononanoate synthase [Pseudomonadota bacterium]
MSWLAPELTRRLASRAAGNRYRHRVIRETGPGAEVQINGQRYVDFSSNDYLGLACHPRVVAAFQRGAERYGVGSGASALVSGYCRAHARLEEDLAVFTGRPRALVFSSGYLANLAVVTTLAGRRDTLIADRFNHASLIDAALLSRARLLRYPHRDTLALERRLQATEGSRRLVVTESLFSMDGDLAPLGRIAALCEHYHAALVVDEAHAIGVLGPGGQGSLAELGLGSEVVPVQIGTFGKALGGLGAFVAGSEDLIETMIQDARSYRYTTALAPAIAEAVREALVLARTESWRREHLRSLIAAFQGGLSEIGIPKSDRRSPIQALVFGEDDSVLEAAERLRRRGLFVAAIRPPTVPIGSARLRVSLTAAHTEGQVTRLVEALAELRGGSS